MIALTDQRLVVLYARYSPRPERTSDTERDRTRNCEDKERNSCDVQLEDLRRHAAAHGYSVVAECRDDAKSGKSLKKRPGLQAALKSCKRGYVLLCRDTKRLARNMLDAFQLVSLLARRGVTFETLHDGTYDHSDPNKLGMFGMKAVFAEMERLRTSIDTKEKMRRHQAGGRRMSDIVPFGYAADPKDPKRIVPSDEEQAVIERILELRKNAGGEYLGYRAIGRTLDAEGLSCRGREWNHKTVKRVLDREHLRTTAGTL